MLTIQELKSFLNTYQGTMEEVPLGGLATELVGITRHFAGEAEAPTNFIFSNEMASISSVVARKVRVLDGSYSNRLNLFWANVGDSGCGKTPARAIVKYILGKKEEEYYAAYQNELREWEQTPPKERCGRPQRDRLLLDNSDTSMEKFLVILDNNTKTWNTRGNGIMLNIDELTDFFPNLNRYSGKDGNPLAKFLLLYNCENISVDRIGREDEYIIEPICTIIGGIQPDRLKMVFGGEYGSGFIPRWLFLLENDASKRVVPNQIYHQYWEGILQCGLEMKPIDLHFSPEAEEELCKNHEKRKEQNILLRSRSKELGEYIVKQNYTVRRLAGIVHVANALAVREEVTSEINVDEYRYAESVVDYLIKSAAVFLKMMSGKSPLFTALPTLEETFVHLFTHIPDLNVSLLSKSTGKDRSNIQRAKRKYVQSLPNDKKAASLSWFHDLEEEFPKVFKIAGGMPNEGMLNALLAICKDDVERFYSALKKLEESPDLEKYNSENIWTEGWVNCFYRF